MRLGASDFRPHVFRASGSREDPARELIKRASRRRAAATGGESTIPLDDETVRCIRSADLDLDDTLATDRVLRARNTATPQTCTRVARSTMSRRNCIPTSRRRLSRPPTPSRCRLSDSTSSCAHPTSRNTGSSRPTNAQASRITSRSRPPNDSSTCCFPRPPSLSPPIPEADDAPRARNSTS